MEHKWNRHWGPELLLKTNTCTISPGYFCIISQDSESRKEASLTKLSIPVKRPHIFNQLDVVFVFEVSTPCTIACIFWVKGIFILETRRTNPVNWTSKWPLKASPSTHKKRKKKGKLWYVDVDLDHHKTVIILEVWWIALTRSERFATLKSENCVH